MNTLSGPMFEGARCGVWESVHNKDGAHYNNYGCRDDDGMAGIRQMFPSGTANEMNFVLFSTSGVHGMYTTIEEVEKAEEDEEGYKPTNVTFLIVHPRICCLRHGNCTPSTPEDFEFLKSLRKSSWDAVRGIGADEAVGCAKTAGNRIQSGLPACEECGNPAEMTGTHPEAGYVRVCLSCAQGQGITHQQPIRPELKAINK